MPQTPADLITALRVEVTEDGHILLDRLERELKLHFWPAQVFDVAVEVFGPALHNPQSRNRLSLDRRIRHAQTVWNNKYGPLNVEQEKYVSSLLCSAIRSGDQARIELKAANATPFVLVAIDKLVNHETVHAGFKRRDGRADRKQEIEGMLA